MSYYDSLETRDPQVREAALLEALPRQIAHAMAHTPYFARHLAGVLPGDIDSREALAQLPLTRKSDLHALQRGGLPFGGLVARSPGELARVFMSPGPIYDPEGRGHDPWRTARVLFAAGFRAGDLVHNSFSYHLTPAGSMLETGLHALGCAVIPAGVGQTELQVDALHDLKPTGYVGTPSFLKILLDKASEAGRPISCLRRAVVSGEAFLPGHRQRFAESGIDAYQSYGTADLGMLAYESSAREGLILNEEVILEIVRPGTADPVAEGEVGEVVITTLNPVYPLIRFATGDLSAVLAGVSPCGRSNTRIRGWMGRADQTTKVRGMFVHPHQVAEVIKRHAGLSRARLIVRHVQGEDDMCLQVECAGADPGLLEALGMSLREVTKLRGAIEPVPPGTLPNDGKVIDDQRKWA
jgi:phenylacetate-CoA ligase